jgi:hypothetical protein
MIEDGANLGADTREFLTLVDNLGAHPMRECRELFDSETDLFVTRAPGRLGSDGPARRSDILECAETVLGNKIQSTQCTRTSTLVSTKFYRRRK